MARWTAEEIDARTSPDRYRFADFLRVASILVVVTGHWFLFLVTERDGELAFDHMFGALPTTQWLTWVFQVMPIFFMVGGYANALSLRSAEEKGVRGTDWLRARAMRLFWPFLPLLVVWTLLASLLVLLGTPSHIVTLLTQVVLVPAWFLAAYLLVVSLAPITYAIHRRYGLNALLLLTALAAVSDLGSRVGGVPYVGYATYFLIWVIIHQAGYFWQEGRLPASIGGRLGMGFGGYAVLVALVFLLGYPLSMVGTNGTGAQMIETNTTPPSIALIALGFGQLGFLLVMERPVSQWLTRPAVWARVVIIGTMIMTIYLWHMTAMVAVAAVVFPSGLWPLTETIDARFWYTRPVWFLTLLVALALLVIGFRRFERSPAARPTTLPGIPGRIVAAIGVICTGLGLALLVVGGLHSEDSFLGLPILPLSLLGAGLFALGVIGGTDWRRRTRPPTESPPAAKE